MNADTATYCAKDIAETGQQLAFLRENKCDEAQRYLFSRPVPSGEIVTLLRRGTWN